MLRPALELAGVQFIDENGGAPVRLAKRGQGEGKARVRHLVPRADCGPRASLWCGDIDPPQSGACISGEIFHKYGFTVLCQFGVMR
jgi:hypothetical protein